ncbi:glutathione peroxidase [Algoriphagus winogradskyi]|uniref:Glutathione peroxidase n=1 Tax=Algoriphagus winogradskyi TaxID=237017 RepID=A0ABY1N7P8_9BACT|nr:glutathione peroxidase [Algoriphagus winogradskyi]SMP02757.1 glutathione peroxidase [Algoriphagus winogradskyi]
MKNLLFLGCFLLLMSAYSISKTSVLKAKNTSIDKEVMAPSFYEFSMKDLNGEMVDFSSFKGKKVMVVNVASKCGYTPQYEELQKLYAEHSDKIVILGFPANNFGGQEPGSNEEIKSFCSENYGVTFPMFEKVSVKGYDKHPIYRWLSDAKQNGWNNEEPSWNFCKYILNEEGELINYFPSKVSPLDQEIIDLINA